MASASDDLPTTLDDLLALDDSRFLASAYLLLLGRPIDPAGFRDYDVRLRSGTPRLQIVAELHGSSEGRLHGAKLPGLAAAMAIHSVPSRPAVARSARDLFRLHDESFVDALVAALLRRPARADERMQYAERLRAGTPKMVVLFEFASQVGDRVPTDVEGLQRIVELARSGLCPVALDLEDLLSFEDLSFVDCAYKSLIGRRPDPAGLSHYGALLRAGHSKIDILVRLARSPEAQRSGRQLPGLARATRMYIIGRVPLLGWLVRLVTKVEGDSSAERRLRAIDNKIERLLQEGARARIDGDLAAATVDDLLGRDADQRIV